ncbi:hypothetical protein M378DRAFT_17669 [Amanita muscaria Koide BX008]|uniref:Uncharacterized protein n=1 Tax=Amanita muscaria (strain Koide BX008) TaxID=946122 RepID=A0A0C2WHY7_AMAMK|nr:hypothetical protein M378DRAFT_17669 [Amanita muscaria Koide BX008]
MDLEYLNFLKVQFLSSAWDGRMIRYFVDRDISAYLPRRSFNPSPSTLNECCQFRAFHDPMICTPANTQLQPFLSSSPFSFPDIATKIIMPNLFVNIPYPFRPAERDDCYAAAFHKDRNRTLASSYRADITYANRPASLRHVFHS